MKDVGGLPTNLVRYFPPPRHQIKQGVVSSLPDMF